MENLNPAVMSKFLTPEVKLAHVMDNANALDAHFRLPENRNVRLKDGDLIRGVKFGLGYKTFKYYDRGPSQRGFVDEFDIDVPETEVGSLKLESRNGIPDESAAVQQIKDTINLVHQRKPPQQRESLVNEALTKKGQNSMVNLARSVRKSNNAVKKSQLETIPEETTLIPQETSLRPTSTEQLSVAPKEQVPIPPKQPTVTFSSESKQAITKPGTVTPQNAPTVTKALRDDAAKLNQALKGAPERTLQVIDTKTTTSATSTTPQPGPGRSQRISNYIQIKTQAAFSSGKISKAVSDVLSTRNFELLAASLVAGVVVGSSINLSDNSNTVLQNQLGQAAEQHQRDLNGCYLYDRRPNASEPKRKISLLTCGQFDVPGSLETCKTQTYASNGTVLNDCPVNTFNPCAKGSTNRSGSGPHVPDACSLYLYKTTPPPTVSGVTTKDACKTPTGEALGENQACSLYCQNSNFNLPAMTDLVCIQVDYPTAYADLLNQLDIPPEDVFVPPPPPSASMSKPLLIAALALGGLFILLGGIYWTRRRRKLILT